MTYPENGSQHCFMFRIGVFTVAALQPLPTEEVFATLLAQIFQSYRRRKHSAVISPFA